MSTSNIQSDIPETERALDRMRNNTEAQIKLEALTEAVKSKDALRAELEQKISRIDDKVESKISAKLCMWLIGGACAFGLILFGLCYKHSYVLSDKIAGLENRLIQMETKIEERLPRR